jgi:hypothetical protein
VALPDHHGVGSLRVRAYGLEGSVHQENKDDYPELLVVIAGVAALGAASARAENGAVEKEDARFTFHRTDDGFLRLDGRSGEVSICTRPSDGWRCQAGPDERVALEGEVARLQAENAALKKELLAHDLAPPSGVKPDSAAKAGEPHISLPSDADINDVMTFVEKVWKRFVDIIVNTQKDLMKRS